MLPSCPRCGSSDHVSPDPDSPVANWPYWVCGSCNVEFAHDDYIAALRLILSIAEEGVGSWAVVCEIRDICRAVLADEPGSGPASSPVNP